MSAGTFAIPTTRGVHRAKSWRIAAIHMALLLAVLLGLSTAAHAASRYYLTGSVTDSAGVDWIVDGQLEFNQLGNLNGTATLIYDCRAGTDCAQGIGGGVVTNKGIADFEIAIRHEGNPGNPYIVNYSFPFSSGIPGYYLDLYVREPSPDSEKLGGSIFLSFDTFSLDLSGEDGPDLIGPFQSMDCPTCSALDIQLSAPEPSSMLILMPALLAMGYGLRRFRSAQSTRRVV